MWGEQRAECGWSLAGEWEVASRLNAVAFGDRPQECGGSVWFKQAPPLGAGGR